MKTFVATDSGPLSATQTAKNCLSGRFWMALIVLAMGVGIVVRWWGLGTQSLWFDEGYTAWMVGHSSGEIIRLVRADTAPPLYYILLHGWTVLFGTSEIALRSMSALAMTLAMFLAMDVARRVIPNRAALCAVAWALALGYFQVQFAKEARCYALMALFTVAAFDGLLIHLAGKNRIWLIPIGLLLAALLYTHNIAMVYVAAFGPAWLVLPSNHSMAQRVKDLALTAALTAILYLPWAIAALADQIHMVRRGFWVAPPTGYDILHVFGSLLGTYHYGGWNQYLRRLHIHVDFIRGWMGFALVVIAAILGLRSRPRLTLGLLSIAVLPPMLVIGWSLVLTPIWMDKTFLASALLLPILAAIPLTIPMRPMLRQIAAAGTVGCIVVMGITLLMSAQDQKEDWRGAARLVANLPPANRRLIIFVANDGQLPFDYYYHFRSGETVTGAPAGFFDRDPPRTMLRVLFPDDVSNLQNMLDERSFDQIVMIYSHADFSDSKQLALNLLQSRYPQMRSQNVNLITVFDATPAPPFHAQ